MEKICQKKKRWMPPQTLNKFPVKKSGTDKGLGGGAWGKSSDELVSKYFIF
jgi:hypothetical protein